MDPRMYMCYMVFAKDESQNSREFVYRYKKEFKTICDIILFRQTKNQIKSFRQKAGQATRWTNFDVKRLMDFIEKYLNWNQ